MKTNVCVYVCICKQHKIGDDIRVIWRKFEATVRKVKREINIPRFVVTAGESSCYIHTTHHNCTRQLSLLHLTPYCSIYHISTLNTHPSLLFHTPSIPATPTLPYHPLLHCIAYTLHSTTLLPLLTPTYHSRSPHAHFPILSHVTNSITFPFSSPYFLALGFSLWLLFKGYREEEWGVLWNVFPFILHAETLQNYYCCLESTYEYPYTLLARSKKINK